MVYRRTHFKTNTILDTYYSDTNKKSAARGNCADGPGGGEFARLHQGAESITQGVMFPGAEQVVQFLGLGMIRVGQQGLKIGQIRQEMRGDGLPGKFPNDCAQFVFCVKTDAMIDGPQPGLVIDQTVAALAVSVVDHYIKEGHAAQSLGVAGILPYGEIVVVGQDIHKKLDAAQPVRTVP